MSPVYCYGHCDEAEGGACPAGEEFEWEQIAADLPLSRCPRCGGPVERLLSASSIRKRKFNSELKDMGFTKLVRVDDGIFENVTRRDGEEKYVNRRDPASFPNLKKTIKD